MNYYFFGASLPTVVLDSAPPLSWDKFRALCHQHLSKEDLDAIDALIAENGEKDDRQFVRDWREREIRLRNSIARMRASRLHRDPGPYLREQAGYDTFMEKAVSDAFARNNPLDREMALDKFRWTQVEDVAGYSPFSSEAIFGYALKLRLAERWAAMSEEKGRDKAMNIINGHKTDAQSSAQKTA